MDRKKLDKLAGKVLPPSFRLEKDRDFDVVTPKNMLDPDKPQDFKKWKDNTATHDLKGYDTTDRGQKSTKQIFKEMHIGYIETEADRLVRSGQESNRLIEDVADEIIDRRTMIEAVKKAFKSDKSLSHLVSKKANLTDKDWDALLNTKKMQDIISKNSNAKLREYIKRTQKVDDYRADTIIAKLPKDKKMELIQKAVRMKPLQTRKKGVKVKKQQPIIPFAKRQKAKSGKVYRRTKPRRWGQTEVNLIKNNKNKPAKEILEIFNQTFKEKRTFGSIRNKLYRLKSSS